MNNEKSIQEIPIEDIIPNRFQPRLSFNEEGINELADSIKQHGIIQPLVVRRLGDKYEIIAGERRYKASTMAGLTKVPVIISDIDDNQSAEVALVENMQRRNLTAIEEAKSYKNLLDRGYLTQEQLADKMGVSQSSIANKLRLLNLDEEVQEALLNEKISERHARSLLAIEDKEEQRKWLQRIIDERLTVRQLDIELKKSQDSDGNEDEGIPLVNINPNLDEIISNAEDIKVERPTHDVASMLIPESGIKEEPKIIEEKIEEPKLEEKAPNKFFNFLEDEEANMDVIETNDIFNIQPTLDIPNLDTSVETNNIEPTTTETISNESTPSIEELLNPVINNTETIEAPSVFDNPILESTIINEKIEEPKKEPENNHQRILNIRDENEPKEEIETIDIPINNELKEEPIIDILEEPIENNQITEILSENKIEDLESTLESSSFKSIFNPDEIVEPISVSEPIPVANNTIEEITPIIEENIIDPLDSIDKLEPDYEQRQEEIAGTDLRTAINTIRETIKNLENKGFILELEEADLESIYHITIKIEKK